MFLSGLCTTIWSWVVSKLSEAVQFNVLSDWSGSVSKFVSFGLYYLPSNFLSQDWFCSGHSSTGMLGVAQHPAFVWLTHTNIVTVLVFIVQFNIKLNCAMFMVQFLNVNFFDVSYMQTTSDVLQLDTGTGFCHLTSC